MTIQNFLIHDLHNCKEIVDSPDIDNKVKLFKKKFFHILDSDASIKQISIKTSRATL